ncbi:MAG TPA: hypothetical protein VMZ53_28515 [Kofleriaceae bacterium]|nr:hypothetical protein [Kofleriaceae bacterium]
MATKKQPSSRSKTKPAAAPQPKGRLHNLAAKPTSFGDEPTMDEQLVDNSGVFRVTAAIARDQIGHDEDAGDPRFASDSLVMAAQRDGFRERGPALDEVTEEVAVDDEAAAVLKRERLRALAARDLARRQRR